MGLADVNADKFQMDNVAAIPDLIRVGEKAAEAVDLPRQFTPFVTPR
jgi:hypothetical protein